MTAPSFKFLSPSTVTKFQGEPLSEDVKYKGVGKICDRHHRSRRLSRKRYEIGIIGPRLILNVGRHRVDQYVSVPVTLSNLDRQDVIGQFLADLHNYVRTVWRRKTRVKYVGRGVSLWSQPRPHPKGRGQASPSFWDPNYAHMVWPWATKFS